MEEKNSMRHYLIASHSILSQGFREALEMLTGENGCLRILTAYVDESDVEGEIEKIVNGISKEDELIVMTDIYGGSVNNIFMQYINRENFYLIAGINLPLLVSITVSHCADTAAMIRENVAAAKESIIYCNDLLDREIDINF